MSEGSGTDSVPGDCARGAAGLGPSTPAWQNVLFGGPANFAGPSDAIN
jgi:hypothetical protein